MQKVYVVENKNDASATDAHEKSPKEDKKWYDNAVFHRPFGPPAPECPDGPYKSWHLKGKGPYPNIPNE